MLNSLNTSVGDYLRDNVILTVVLALILALILVLSIIMIILQMKAKKDGGALDNTEPEETAQEPQQEPEPENTQQEPEPQEEPQASFEEAPVEEPEEAQAQEPTEQPAEEPGEEPQTEQTEETPAEPQEEPVTEEKAPAKPAKTEPVVRLAAKKPAPAKAATPKKSEEKKDDDKSVGFQDGKWVIRKTPDGKYAFKLYASNGSVMLESSKEYSSLSTAKQGIETYKRNFREGNCKIVSPKSGSFVYRLTNANGMLLAVSPNYTSKSSCENALENTKSYAKNAPVEVI